MRYYIIAGEASGDLHGSNLIKALREKDNKAEIWAWGGDMMEQAGARIRKHYRDLAFMGFLEVVKNLKTILRNIDFCKKDMTEFQPDVVIFVDYPGFNLRIAKWAKLHDFKTFYYISPQIWAWHSSRVHGIKATVDRMFCIIPFEKDFYKKYDYDVDYVGHPLLDVVDAHVSEPNFRAFYGLDERPIIAVLAGSRRQEIDKMLQLMLSVVPHFKQYQFVIAGAPSLPVEFYDNILKIGQNMEYSDIPNPFGTEGIKIVRNQTYDLLSNAAFALVKSGTSTLETALFDVPQVVCYKGSNISYSIAKRVVQVRYISLVNLIADEPIVKELIQKDLTEKNLILALTETIENQLVIKGKYKILRGLLGNNGAAEKTANLMMSYL
jgi:lipid-A-disaccharide synthase